MLFMLGRIDVGIAFGRSIAIVGSRNPTPQGKANAHAFAEAFSQAGLTVISGLALGIDGAAHEGALDGAAQLTDQVTTVAVVGTGLDRVYPARHLALARRIAQNGLIVSEFLLGTPPLNPNFPKRNRIIAGLSQGTLVVEAALQSGSLITARLAVEQGKEVFAIPGSIHSPQSRGCHALIKQGAKLVESVDDIFEELHIPPPAASAAVAPLAAAEHPVMRALGHDAVTLDTLAACTGWPAAELSAWLLERELEGQVARLPGGLYQRLHTG
jgi:DNA processing protein